MTTPTGGRADGQGDPRDLETRLSQDEARLSRDESRLAEGEQRTRTNRLVIYGLGAALALTAVALVMSWYALNRDIKAVAKAAPKDDSVGAAALRDGAVGSDAIRDEAVVEAKIAPGAVTASRLAPGALGAASLGPKSVTSRAIADRAVAASALADRSVVARAVADGAVTGRAMADNSVSSRAVGANVLRGEDINESTLGPVARATRADTAATADRAATADNTRSLGGVAAGRYVKGVTQVTAASQSSTLGRKGPVTASCPSGTSVIGGGARVEGARDVALSANGPDGTSGWTAQAAVFGKTPAAWRVVVTAICAKGG